MLKRSLLVTAYATLIAVKGVTGKQMWLDGFTGIGTQLAAAQLCPKIPNTEWTREQLPSAEREQASNMKMKARCEEDIVDVCRCCLEEG